MGPSLMDLWNSDLQGFDQANGVRTFHFQAFIDSKELREYAVTADMTLFGKHHVGIQEGPALCSRLVMAGLALHSRKQHRSLLLRKTSSHMSNRGEYPKRKAFRRRGRFGALNSR